MFVRSRALVVMVVIAIALAACGSDEPAVSGPTEAVLPTPGLPFEYTGPDGVTTTIDSAARIVTLSGEFSEIVWELGLGDNLVGVDLSSEYPADEMRAKTKIGVEFRLFAEPVLALEPTVVIGDTDARPPEVIDQIRSAGVPVVIFPRLAGTRAPADKIRQVGEVLGLADGGDTLAGRVQAEIDAALAPVAATTTRPKTAVVYIATADQVLLLGDNTVFEGLLEAVGAVDVGPEAGADGFVPLTAEAIAAAAPEVIITAQRGFDNRGGLEAFLALPGIAQTPAAESGRILVYDDALLLTLGPRTAQVIEQIVSDLHPELTE